MRNAPIAVRPDSARGCASPRAVMPSGQVTSACWRVPSSATVRLESATDLGSLVPGRIGWPMSVLPPGSTWGDSPRTTSFWPATQAVAPPAASTAQHAPAATSFVPPVAAPPRTPASGPRPTGGVSARRRVRVDFRPRAELAAAGAALDVAHRVLGRPAALVVGGQQVVADARAVVVARRGRGGQPGAGALDQLAAGLRRDLQRLGHLVVAEAVELAHQQRGALLLGQVGEVLDQRAQLVAAAERGVDVLGRAVVDVLEGRALLAQLVDADVAHDAVQPRLELERTVVGAQPVMRPHERLLDDALGVVDVRARGHRLQPPRVALVDDLERLFPPLLELLDQMIVGTEAHVSSTSVPRPP